MKKVLVLAVIALTSVMSTYALDLNEYKVFYKLNNETTFKSLTRYLKTSVDQDVELKNIFAMTEKRMKTALNSESEKDAEKAMWFNLGNAKSILTDDQYKKYLTAINLSVYTNNGEYFAEK